MFMRTESVPQFIRLYPAVSILLLINILMFFLTSLPIFPEYTILKWLSGFNRYIAAGEWWRLLSPLFLHVSFSHLLFNCFSIVILAPYLEMILGHLRFCVFFLAAGAAANIATFLLHPMSYVHVGSSGAIFGVLGYYLWLALIVKDGVARQHATTIYGLTALAVIMTFIQPDVNVTGHLGGFAAGIALAPLFTNSIKGHR
ncbi:rhomboid family intramembrane serine protease [Peribacillus glennii]|uniref:Rhomboid family intramembrane serine protease n=1 Tax=Peribacillus glennii TaxID=2303991 RepID=A0A372L6H7_9BACI|nr:rhomboid family intramembrane serine protease [Peribacillus glennii]RFU60652.1 rhomboid family intramembrane serine protease [Peribacillus glennii]